MFYASKLATLMSLLETLHTVQAKRSPKNGESISLAVITSEKLVIGRYLSGA